MAFISRLQKIVIRNVCSYTDESSRGLWLMLRSTYNARLAKVVSLQSIKFSGFMQGSVADDAVGLKARLPLS
jgi:sugar (pentulose or hexulose) kinase